MIHIFIHLNSFALVSRKLTNATDIHQLLPTIEAAHRLQHENGQSAPLLTVRCSTPLATIQNPSPETFMAWCEAHLLDK